jgi:Domain of unknown function (DUF222)/HNH endonuclease
MQPNGSTKRAALCAELDSAHAAVTAAQRHLLEVIAECDREETWRVDGSRDLAQWLSARLGISNWAARRWINAAHVLPCLPLVSAALEAGTLSIDKIVELCRFATPATERRWITWARRVTVAGIRRKAELANRSSEQDVVEADRTRFFRYWWFEDGKRLGLEGALPADQGAVVAKALDRIADRVPDIIDEDQERPISSEESLDIRRADALVAMASCEIACDQDADRATVVVHAELGALCGDAGGCEIEGGPVINPETARRLSCDARLQLVLHDEEGEAVGIGRVSRTAPPWLLRQLRFRDRGCTFPGCESKRFLHAHHIEHWGRGGPTDLDNLVLVCTLHHKLVHEYGWRVELDLPGAPSWSRPTGRRFDPGLPTPQGPERAPPRAQVAAVA